MYAYMYIRCKVMQSYLVEIHIVNFVLTRSHPGFEDYFLACVP